ncbi:MAG: MotA/TolQ/ExbB proton channel family protein [Candidatus Margulisbacteria bacterium]|nr:MotA/TolQ/ExbB proton channel family protein [Candidatus Margulisiibacteriota bacterium]
MFQLIIKGGPVMFLLLLCSIGGVYIIIQKMLFLKIYHTNISPLIDKVKHNLSTIGVDDTIKALRHERGIISRVITCAIKLAHLPREDVQEGIKEATYKELPKLERNMNFLSSIITVAPILGLLGTVLGLMDIFNVISGGGLGDTAALSSGIAEALITTVTGLLISIPFIFSYQYLNHRIDCFSMDLDRISNEIINYSRLKTPPVSQS